MEKNSELKRIVNKFNWMCFATSVIATLGILMIILSFIAKDLKIQNVFVGLGTGLITSSIVSLFIEIINKQNIKKKTYTYKLMLLNPIAKITETIYIDSIMRINDFLIDNNKSTKWIIDLDDNFEDLKKFIKDLKRLDYSSQNEIKKKRLDELLKLPKTYYKELISLYYNIPFDTLLWEELITQDEYKRLKEFYIVDRCKENIHITNNSNSQSKYLEHIELFKEMILLSKKIINTFDHIKTNIKYHKKIIVDNLNDKYYRNVYCNSEKYIIKQQEEYEAKMEYYSDHPEEIPTYDEETEERKLHKKINEAIWRQDKDKIVELFPQINKDYDATRKMFSKQLAHKIMKNKVLKQLYIEKYGVKYKPSTSILKRNFNMFKKSIKKLKYKHK